MNTNTVHKYEREEYFSVPDHKNINVGDDFRVERDENSDRCNNNGRDDPANFSIERQFCEQDNIVDPSHSLNGNTNFFALDTDAKWRSNVTSNVTDHVTYGFPQECDRGSVRGLVTKKQVKFTDTLSYGGVM